MDSIQNYWEFTIFESIYYLSPYIIFNGLGLICGLLLLDHNLKKHINKNNDKIYILFVISIAFGWLGAHLLDVLLKKQSIGSAGFTFFGGLIFGTAFFIILFLLYFNKNDLINTLNTAVRPLILGHAIGRLGCYFSGCCYGKIIDHPDFLYSIFTRHPTQLYETIFLLILFIFLSLKEKLRISVLDIYVYLTSYSIFRFFVEFLRDDYRGLHIVSFSPSQWISLSIVMIFLILLSIKFINISSVSKEH